MVAIGLKGMQSWLSKYKWGDVPIEISIVFVGIVLFTVLAGLLCYIEIIPTDIPLFFFVLGGWVISLALHEFGHAFVAYVAGDWGVVSKGYLTLNPIKYTQSMLSIVLPVLILLMGGIGLPGGAVYVNKDSIWDRRMRSLVSAAGPIATAAFAVVLLIPFSFGIASSDFLSHRAFWSGMALLAFLQISALFLNLIPIPPLDGYGILEPFLPANIIYEARRFGSIGFFLVLILLLYTPIGDYFWSLVSWTGSILGLDFVLVFEGFRSFQFWR
jgi:Zn-dependent protease